MALSIRALIVAASMIFLAPTMPAGSAEDIPQHLRKVADVAGLPHDFMVMTEEDADSPGAYFTEGGVQCVWMVFCMEVEPHIYIGMPKEWPKSYAEAALLHEIGHYWQVKRGEPTDEWAADDYAITMMCKMGRNGPEEWAELMTAITPYVVVDSEPHGNHFRRIDHAREQRCSGPPHAPQS